jgi:hypothetical protein
LVEHTLFPDFGLAGMAWRGREVTMTQHTGTEEFRCPICGEGVVADIAYDLDSPMETGGGFQEPDSQELITYTCGHKAPGPTLKTADADQRFEPTDVFLDFGVPPGTRG